MIHQSNTAQACLKQAKALPCWHGEVEPVPLSGGLSNHNFVVEDNGKKYVVRMGGDNVIHNVMRFNEHACLRAAEEIGITPSMIYASPDALVIDFVEGKTFDEESIKVNIERLLPSIYKLHTEGAHAVRGPVLGFSAFHVARHYGKILLEANSRMLPELPRFLAIAQELEIATGAIDWTLCHNDLLAANFIDDGEKIWIIDWEHAGFSTPLFDLANIASNSELSAEQEQQMLKHYYQAEVDETLWKRFRALRAVSHLREAMWSMVSEIYSDVDEDFVAYTQTNLVAFEDAYKGFKTI
ncbi:MAG: phosphotransferase [Arenicellales bacterium WSBS_2016_MAG_OTU3]